MIYDVFLLFNEIDLLDIRLNILENVVDKFIIIESNKTFSGKNKDLYYYKNRARFEKWWDKIEYKIVDNMPIGNTSEDNWAREFHQRNIGCESIYHCNDDDIIIVSDVDEVPNPNVLKKERKGIANLQMDLFWYSIRISWMWSKRPKRFCRQEFIMWK